MTERLPDQPGWYRYLVLFALTLAFMSNFLDRQILAILTEPVKQDLGLSDTQIGILSGPVFAVFYATFAIPLAWLSDRVNRVRIIAACCAAWSLFTAACGLANNFAQLALARMGVAIGEAGGSPPSNSLISDYFPPAQRGRALAIYSFGVAAGPALGAAIGGSIAAQYGWRTAFFVVGLPGVLIALFVLLVIREPQRGRLDAGARSKAQQPAARSTLPLGESIRLFFQQRTLRLTAAATACSAFVGYGMGAWLPALLMRTKGMTLSDIAVYYSLASGTAAALGTLTSGWLVDRFSRRSMRAYALVPAGALMIGLPFLLLGAYAPTWQASVLLLMVPQFMGNMFLAPGLAVIQNVAQPTQRGISAALLLFFLNLIGLGGGPLFVGFISDLAPEHWNVQPLQLGLTALAPLFLIGIGAHYLNSLSLKRDDERARMTGQGVPEAAS